MRPSKLRLPDNTLVATMIAFLHGCGDLGQQGTRIADAGRAAVANRVKTDGVEIVEEL